MDSVGGCIFDLLSFLSKEFLSGVKITRLRLTLARALRLHGGGFQAFDFPIAYDSFP